MNNSSAGPARSRLSVYPPQISTRPSLRRKAKYLLAQLKYSFRASVRVRVVLTAMMLGGIVIFLLGIILTVQVKERVFADRLEQILSDARIRVRLAQEQAKVNGAQSAAQAQAVANDLVTSFQNGVSGITGAILMNPPKQSGVAILEPYVSSTVSLRPLITAQMRQAVQRGTYQYWQSVEIKSSGYNAPGVVVGTLVTLPLAGAQEIYLVYSLEQEQRTVQVVMVVMAIGVVLLGFLMAAFAWFIAQTVIRSVKEVSSVARDLAAGDIAKRAPVNGEDELAILASSFNNMADSLEAQIREMEEIGKIQQRFVSDVSHELRTPMTTIRMAADLIASSKEALPIAQQRATELLQSQIDRFEAMLRDLLEISRFDSGAARLNVETVDIGEIVKSVVGFSHVLAEKQHVNIYLEEPDKPANLLCDRVRVERIVRNLVVNAIEHAEARPVEIAWDSNELVVQVRVTDHGVGLSAEQASHVFDRFWRADPSRNRTTGGTGLGLAISLEDAVLHGGTIQVHGMLGIGTSFILMLPREPRGPLGDGPLAPVSPAILQEGEAEIALGDTGELPPVIVDNLEENNE